MGTGCQAKGLDLILEAVARSGLKEWGTLPTHRSSCSFPSPTHPQSQREGQVDRPLEAAGPAQQSNHGAEG